MYYVLKIQVHEWARINDKLELIKSGISIYKISISQNYEWQLFSSPLHSYFQK